MLLSPDYVTSKVVISQKKAPRIITTKLSCFKLIQLTQNYASFLYCEFRLVFFIWNTSCDFVENRYQIKTRKRLQILLKTTKVHTEKAKISNLNIASTFVVSRHESFGTFLTGLSVVSLRITGSWMVFLTVFLIHSNQ